MRWKVKGEDPTKGTIVVEKKFLWLPKCINKETRWLEKASWEKIWKVDADGVGHWSVRKWVD